ncbi:MAG: PhnD/SsuA/transferrin family substrate-binding protein [Acidimicrobiales bacterium]
MSRPGGSAGPPYASFGMYPFPHLVPAWERLWAVVRQETSWAPDRLRWEGEVQDHWRDPACAAAHACGWPVAAELGELVDVVGAFTLALPDADGHRYRSVLLAADPGAMARATAPDPDTELVLAANSADSLSGWISLLAALGLASWPGAVRWTGAHVLSLAALRGGEAHLACIDSLTLAHLRAADPAVDAGLHVVGTGPWIPNPAVVVRRGMPAATRRALAAALRTAVGDPAVGRPLCYDGFVELSAADYEPTTRLVPASA